MKLYLTGARVVLADALLADASVLVEDGVIAAIDPVSANADHVIDLAGGTLLPGLIDLHCDALEKEVEPRPNVHFPLGFACAQADKRSASAGVTTVFHALSFAHEELGVRNNAFAAAIVRAVHAWNSHALVDNRVHCRYEITDAEAPTILRDLLAAGEIHLLSVMDHSPGQGQFKDIAAYRDYLARTYRKSAAELDALLENKFAQASDALKRMRELIAVARQHGVPVASHDDDTPAKVDMLAGLGVGISEFPVTLAAACAAHERGFATVFGAPNILRGQSQSGSMRALDAVVAGVADCLCADYHPATLLAAVFRLPALAGIPLPAAVRLVSLHPARAADLTDRGEIAVGKRADLVAVREIAGEPQASQVFVAGRSVFAAHYDT